MGMGSSPGCQRGGRARVLWRVPGIDSALITDTAGHNMAVPVLRPLPPGLPWEPLAAKPLSVAHLITDPA